ncbi:histidine phosphatase family protein [Curtobacterium sp. MCBD17_013]|uniref:histidine phosphatase family protein n=1 Tax=Curtobacterium sp. MCBD17_013 TaxID=2175668 RepID=UPI000DA946FE|nr:histidine phosphatase family protein [Curtobacterium sp. MCBD17_013]PZF61840.1 histidine phosphatase family protein [Curtobacterium sp. MCBD17_013]
MDVTELWLVRHGESTANVAAAEAERAGQDRIVVDHRDADVPLSPLGERQARALGAGLTDRQVDGVPFAVWVSSYHRAQETIRIALDTAEVPAVLQVDERLRDRELGVLDLLTSTGVRHLFPDEAERRRWLGKYYHRPAGGESWVDVMLRLRSVLHDVDAQHDAQRLVLAAHDAVVMLTVAICTGMDEAALLDFARTHTVANASLTRLTRDRVGAPWRLEEFSAVDHLDDLDTPVTEHEGSIPNRGSEDAHAGH